MIRMLTLGMPTSVPKMKNLRTSLEIQIFNFSRQMFFMWDNNHGL